MSYKQLIKPNPNIPCRPGWCLQYVREAFGLPAVHPTATAAWEASPTKHRDRNFPSGVWIAVWYGLSKEPAGHVVLRAPDGSVYSTSDLDNTPHHHPDLADLERFYARYGMTLTYRGWTEDVQGTRVIEKQEENPMATASEQWLKDHGEAIARIDQRTLDTEKRVQEVYDRVYGRNVQRYYHPTTLEVREEPFEGAVPARTTDLHDVLTSNALLVGQVAELKAALAAKDGE